MFFGFSFIISYTLIGYLSICAHIICIVHDFNLLRVAKKNQSHGFFVEWWVVHSRFIELGNLTEIVMHYFLIGEMTWLNHRNDFLIVSALIYWCTLNVTYSESWHKVIDCHNSLNYYTAWTLNFEKILSLCQG